MNYALRTPAANGETVTQGDTNYCRENGHKYHLIDGVDQGICPRCGESTKETPANLKEHTTAEYRFDREQDARDERRNLINEGCAVSLLSFDPTRHKYVFDLY